MASPSNFSFGHSSGNIDHRSRESLEFTKEKIDMQNEEKKEKLSQAKKSSMETAIETTDKSIETNDKPKKIAHNDKPSSSSSGEKVLKGFYVVAAAPVLAVGAVKNAAKEAFKNKDTDVKETQEIKRKKDSYVEKKDRDIEKKDRNIDAPIEKRRPIEREKSLPNSPSFKPAKNAEKRRTIDFKRAKSEKDLQAELKKMHLEKKKAEQLEMRNAYEIIVSNPLYMAEFLSKNSHTDLIILEAEGESGLRSQIDSAKEAAKNFLISKGIIEKEVRLSPQHKGK